MREWQVGDPIGDGNDIGVPDIPYMDYLRKDEENEQFEGDARRNVELSRQYLDEALKLNKQNKFYDALTFINAAIRHNPDDDENWNVKGIILWNILETNDISVGQEAYHCFNKALEINPNAKIIKKNKIGFMMKWAFELTFSGEYDPAMIRVNEALSIIEDKTSDEYAWALAIKVTVYMGTQNFKKSMEYYDMSIEVNPLDVNVRKMKLELIRRMADYYDEDLFPWVI